MFSNTSLFSMQMAAKKPNTPLSKKQIPTLLGLAILVVSLVAGVLLFGNGTGVFSPRATPQTTPQNISISNVSDRSFTISFYTDEATTGFVKYGTEQGALRSQALDDRDQLSGTVGNYQLHQVTVRGLTPNTQYFYTVGTASVPNFDNNGVPFAVITYPALSETPPLNKTIYGTVATPAGSPAEGSVVFVSGEGMSELSSLVKSSGSWAIALSSARSMDGSAFADLTESSMLQVVVQGTTPELTSSFSLPISSAQPVPEVTLGSVPEISEEPAEVVVEGEETLPPEESPVAGGGLNDILGQLAEEQDESEEEVPAVLDLAKVAEGEQPTVSAQPVITGEAAPGVAVTIEVHSDTQISQTLVADENGQFSLDISSLGQQLEPGEHTVTYTYVDPTSGQEVTRSQTFFVSDTSNQLAQANTTSPFGSGNPVPVVTPTPTPTPELEPTTTPVTEPTRSAVVATDSGMYQAGSVENTVALIVGGVFFIFAGGWSWWLAQEVKKK